MRIEHAAQCPLVIAPYAGLIRDERDYRTHMDYVHINPVKHGLVKRVADWPYSTFHRMVAEGICPANWAGGSDGELEYED